MELDVNKIQEILPHGFPFLLVDKIISMENDKVVGIKNVTINEWFPGAFSGKTGHARSFNCGGAWLK